MNRVRQFLVYLRSSLWFVPGLMVGVAIGLAFALVNVDGYFDRELQFEYPRVFGAGASGSRAMLSAIASSMITVAGLTFSLTLVAITQASSQYTPRVLRNFMRDRGNQFVLGYFVGVFTYALIVLRTIRGGDEGGFIPSIAVLLGLVLAIASVGVLIFFVHHIASSIQASAIISSVANETLAAIERLFPEELGEEADEDEPADFVPAGTAWRAIEALKSGYLQDVDADGLLGFAVERNAVVRMESGVGEFVTRGAPLITLAGEAAIDEKIIKAVNALFSLGHYRTIEQDAAFGVRQIVDIALKALSPGVNDTSTAIVGIDYLGTILAAFARRRVEHWRRAEDGQLRVLARGVSFASLTSEAFDQIRDVAKDNVAIYVRLLKAMATVARQTPPPRRAVLAAHVARIAEAAEGQLQSDYNRERVRACVVEARDALGDTSATQPSAKVG